MPLLGPLQVEHGVWSEYKGRVVASGGCARFVRLLSGPIPAVGAALRAPAATGAGGFDGVLRCGVLVGGTGGVPVGYCYGSDKSELVSRGVLLGY